MPPKRELCRNFQRGSCRYGDKCRFLHSTQQQPKPNTNPFGFGVQNSSNFQSTTVQQPNSNPFGFGVQNVSQQNGGANFGASRQSHTFKPFENKWTRTSSTTGGSSTVSQQNQNQSQASNHKCIDPNECKKLMAADFEQERPLWKLTCYGHFKHLPCDISGDTSYEELRAAAYEDARRGIPLQSIVERERNLHNSKLLEFESLLGNPYTKQGNLAQPLPNPFPSMGQNPSSLTMQNHNPSPLSSFGQPATSFGMGSSLSSSGPPSNPYGFGQPGPSFGTASSLSSSGPPSNPFGFGQINNPSQPSTIFGSSSTGSGNPVPLGGQISTSGGGGTYGAFPTNTSSFNNSGMSSQSNSQPPTSFQSQNFMNTATNRQPVLLNASGSHLNGSGQATINSVSLDNMPKATSIGDASIWLKADWKLGEIPEDVPPDEYIK